MRHCPECRRLYPEGRDVCPPCWEPLLPGEPARDARLDLVYATAAVYEADMVATLLQNEGIPCLRVPHHPGSLWPLASAGALGPVRLYVRADMAPAARELIAEVTGGSAGGP